jgi:hypothetical protein
LQNVSAVQEPPSGQHRTLIRYKQCAHGMQLNRNKHTFIFIKTPEWLLLISLLLIARMKHVLQYRPLNRSRFLPYCWVWDKDGQSVILITVTSVLYSVFYTEWAWKSRKIEFVFQAKKAYGGVEIRLALFTTLTLNGCVCSASRPDRLTFKEITSRQDGCHSKDIICSSRESKNHSAVMQQHVERSRHQLSYHGTTALFHHRWLWFLRENRVPNAHRHTLFSTSAQLQNLRKILTKIDTYILLLYCHWN